MLCLGVNIVEVTYLQLCQKSSSFYFTLITILSAKLEDQKFLQIFQI